MNLKRKASNRKMKAVYQIHISINFLNASGVFDVERAKRKAKSFWFWSDRLKRQV